MRQLKSQASAEKRRDDIPSADTVNRTMGAREWGLVVILSVIWGGSFFFVEIAIREMTPLSIVMCRVGLAAIVLVGFARLTGRKMPGSPGVWATFLVMGALNNAIPFSLIVWGQTHIESSLASILNATTPIFSVVLAHMLTREERLTVNRGLGVLVGWAGVAILIGTDSIQGINMETAGEVAVLGAAMSYAFAAIFGRRFKGSDPVVVAAGMLCGAAVLMIPLAFIFEQPWNLEPHMTTWVSVLMLSVLSTSVAYILYFRILRVAGATNLMLVTFLIPVSAITLGVLFLGEQPGGKTFLGMAVIFLGLIAIDGRLIGKYRNR